MVGYTFETAFAEENDITFVLRESWQNGEIVATQVWGFYYGEPNEELTDEVKKQEHPKTIARY